MTPLHENFAPTNPNNCKAEYKEMLNPENDAG
jgi:hypothetical protein